MVVALTAAADVSAGAQNVTYPSSLDDLVDVYDVESVPVDIVVAIDTSSSMIEDGDPPPWPAVQSGWDTLVDALGPADRLGLVTFDATAVRRFDLEALGSELARADAKAQLPDVPDGTATDIGAGLDAAVETLGASGGSEIQTLVFITDGKHNPTAGSKYPGTSGPAWPTLQQDAKALNDARADRLAVFGWGLGGAGSTDIALVQSVFSQTQIIDLPDRQVAGFLESLADDVQRQRVRPEVENDLAMPLTVDIAVTSRLQPETTADLTITNPRSGLPTTVQLQTLTVTEADGTVVPTDLEPQELELAPGETTTVSVTLKPAGADHGLAFGNQVDERTWTVAVGGQSELTEDLTTLLATEQLASRDSTTGETSTTTPTVTVSNSYGISWTTVFVTIAVALLVLVLLALFLRWLLVPPPLTGSIERREADGEYATLQRLRGKRAQLSRETLDTAQGDEVLELFTKPRTSRGSVYVRSLGGAPRRNGQIVGSKGRRLAGGDTFEMCDQTLRYQKLR
jgi:hypothetical protein